MSALVSAIKSYWKSRGKHSGPDGAGLPGSLELKDDDSLEGRLLVIVQQLPVALDVVSFRAGDVIVKQGDPSEIAYYLISGTVQVHADTRHGTVPLAKLSAPRLIGEIGVLAGLPRTAGITAVSEVSAYPLSKELMLQIGHRTPALLQSVIAQLGRQISVVNKTIGLYTTALKALEDRETETGILDDLARPPPELAEFATAFQRFAQEIAFKRRQHDELAAAALIQKSFLPQPTQIPDDDRFSFVARMLAAREVGGDFYDYFMLDRDKLFFAIGDICGKGVPASLFMAVVVTVLRSCVRERATLQEAMARANTVLCMDNPAGLFATSFCGIYDIASGSLEYCNCGHNAPYMIDRAGNVQQLPATGLPLGLYDDRSPAARRVDLREGDLLCLFTDGITEANDEQNTEFGEDRLEELVSTSRDLPADALAQRLFSAVSAFAGAEPQSDDITCIVLRRG